MSYEALFSPIKIRNMELKNRVVLPAMMTKMATREGNVTERLINYHVARAKGGCGLNLLECCAIHESTHGIGYVALYTRQHMQGVKKLVEAVHEVGGKVGAQIWHGGRVAVALLPPERKPMLTETMTKEDIKTIVDCYGRSTALAVEAGCDCIEFHAAHTYLPHTFLSAAFNKRNDEYNGPLENRARFALECIASMRKNMPDDMPLFMRLDAQDDYVENGLTIDDVIAFIKMTIDAGVDVADISRGNGVSAALKYEVPPIDIPRGYNIDNVAKIRAGVSIPVVAVGRINYPELANSVVAEGKADLVAIGRAQIADPEFCSKAQSGNTDLIRRCVGCNQGCFDSIMDESRPHITCMRNPLVGKEGEAIPKAARAKKVLIAGAGIGGLMAASMLKKRGHEPVVYEATDRLGGQMILAGKAPYKHEMEDAAVWEGEEAKRLDVEIHLNTPVTPELIEQVKPDEVIIAIGAEPDIPALPGVSLPHVSHAHEVLDEKKTPAGNVVIIGGGLVGLEVAQYLTAKGAKCTVLEMGKAIGEQLGWTRKICINENLHMTGVQFIVNATCTKITENEVIYEQEGAEKSIACDHVVIANGAKPRPSTDLQNKCKSLGISYHIIGDAVSARYALNATAEGMAVALEI